MTSIAINNIEIIDRLIKRKKEEIQNLKFEIDSLELRANEEVKKILDADLTIDRCESMKTDFENHSINRDLIRFQNTYLPSNVKIVEVDFDGDFRVTFKRGTMKFKIVVQPCDAVSYHDFGKITLISMRKNKEFDTFQSHDINAIKLRCNLWYSYKDVL